MKLVNAAQYFDRMACVDAYTGKDLFHGQFDLFDDSKRDGSTVTRRIISTGPEPSLPPRGVINVGGHIYVLGKNHTDWFDSSVIREKFVLFPVVELVTVSTEEQALANTGGQMYGGRVWVKNLKEAATSSEKFPIYNIYASLTETVVPNQLVYVDNRWHRVLTVFQSAAGFLAMEAAELDTDAITTATLVLRGGHTTYNPVTDVYTVSVGVSVAILVERFQTFYVYETAATPRPESGDIRATFLQAEVATLEVGSTFVTGGKTYEVISAVQHGTAWHAQARLVS